jgi:chemotaxis signal transduction protein/ABC-type nitrate/sulfonate/bicarbonate transport system substrate-binding protein/AmiR/NasT family two-component response regulator
MTIDFKQLTILIADDLSSMRLMQTKILEQLGCSKIIVADDGADAIVKIKKHQQIDLVISDWNMPNKDGLDLLKWMRSEKKYKDIPFIMATAQSDKAQEKKAFKIGVNGFIAKPFGPEDIRLRVEEIMGKGTESEDSKEWKTVITESGKRRLKVAHIQITDHLPLGVLKHMLDQNLMKSDHFELELSCMPGWNPVGQALENGSVDAACILAPMAMDLFHFDVPINIVLLTHRNGSIFVRNSEGTYKKPYQDFYKNSTFAIPHKMSVHHMLSHLFLQKVGCNPSLDKGDEFDIELEVIPPINMPDFLQENPKHSGFMVAEPIGSRAISAGLAQFQFFSNELWENHPCCVLVFRKEYIEQFPEAVHELTAKVVEVGNFISQEPDEASAIGVSFLDPQKKMGLTRNMLKQVLTQPGGITTDNLYPDKSDLNTMQQYMVKELNVGALVDLDKLVDTRFADSAYGEETVRVSSKLHEKLPDELLNRGTHGEEMPAVAVEQKDMKVEHREAVDTVQLNQLKKELKEKENKINQIEKRLSSVEETVKILRESNIEIQNSKKIEDANKAITAETYLNQYLTFKLEKEVFALEITKIREVLEYSEVMKVPNMPDFMCGIINLRGKVVPVTDLRLKFNMSKIVKTVNTCIIIIEISLNNEIINIGAMVDAVQEVIELDSDKIEPPPKIGTEIDDGVINGMGKIDDQFIICINVEKVFSSSELSLIEDVEKTP